MAGAWVLFAAVCLAPAVLFWCALKVPVLVHRALDRRRARLAPSGPPVERLAADLRRVHRLLVDCPPGTPAARRLGTRQAYDELLTMACREVGVAHRLDTVAEGIDRDLERLRVEEALRRAGLAVP